MNKTKYYKLFTPVTFTYTSKLLTDCYILIRNPQKLNDTNIIKISNIVSNPRLPTIVKTIHEL